MDITENRRVKLSKKMLKEALISLLESKDIYKISIRELCELADVNRTTFYKYYGSQFDLLNDLENDSLKLINEAIDKNVENREQILVVICRYLEQNITISKLLLNNNVDPTFPEKLFSLNSIQDIYAKYVSCPNTDEEMNMYMYNYITYGIYQVIRIWINNESREKADVFAKRLMELLQN